MIITSVLNKKNYDVSPMNVYDVEAKNVCKFQTH